MNKPINESNFAEYLVGNYPEKSLSENFLAECDEILRNILKGFRYDYFSYNDRLRQKFGLNISNE